MAYQVKAYCPGFSRTCLEATEALWQEICTRVSQNRSQGRATETCAWAGKSNSSPGSEAWASECQGKAETGIKGRLFTQTRLGTVNGAGGRPDGGGAIQQPRRRLGKDGIITLPQEEEW